MTISPKFAYLPNGIIREIVAYTGLIFKNRNGKYMEQISKDDPRYKIIQKIPMKRIIYDINSGNIEFLSIVSLKRSDDFCILYNVSCIIWEEKEYINYNLYRIDSKSRKRRNYHWREEVGSSTNI